MTYQAGTEDVARRAVAAGLITEEERAAAVRVRADRGVPLEDALEELGLLTEDQVVALHAAASGVQPVFPYARSCDPELVASVPAEVLRLHDALPLAREEDRLVVALPDPDDQVAVRAIERAVGAPIRAVLAGRHRLRRVLAELLGPAIRLHPDRAVDSAALALFYGHLARALDCQAEELRFDVQGDELLVRCRTGGSLILFERSSATLQVALVARAMSLLGHAATEAVRDTSGLVSTHIGGRDVRLEVSVIPGVRDTSVLLAFRQTAAEEPPQSEAVRRALGRIGALARGLALVVSDEHGRATDMARALVRAMDTAARAAVCVLSGPHTPEPSVQHVETGGGADALSRAMRRRPDVVLVDAGTIDGPGPDALAVAARAALVVAVIRERDPLEAVALLVEGAAHPGAFARGLVAVVDAQPGRPVTVLEPGAQPRAGLEQRAPRAALRAAAAEGVSWT